MLPGCINIFLVNHAPLGDIPRPKYTPRIIVKKKCRQVTIKPLNIKESFNDIVYFPKNKCSEKKLLFNYLQNHYYYLILLTFFIRDIIKVLIHIGNVL